MSELEALATAVAAAGPVLLVAFYAMRQGPDLIEEAMPVDYVIDVPHRWAWLLVKPVRGVLALGGHVKFDRVSHDHWKVDDWSRATSPQAPIAARDIRSVVLNRDFAQGGDFGFIWRTPASFVTALCPLVPGVGEDVGKVSVAVSLVLLMLNLNLLLTYCAQIGAIRYAYAARTRTGLGGTYPWRVVRAASLSGTTAIVGSLVLAVVLVRR